VAPVLDVLVVSVAALPVKSEYVSGTGSLKVYNFLDDNCIEGDFLKFIAP
jgi:hypothetical protein